MDEIGTTKVLKAEYAAFWRSDELHVSYCLEKSAIKCASKALVKCLILEPYFNQIRVHFQGI